jgi:hypothetical protein
MEQSFWTVFAASLFACAVTTSGIFAIRRYEGWARQNVTYFACFAAGVLIAISFVHIIPTSFSSAGDSHNCGCVESEMTARLEKGGGRSSASSSYCARNPCPPDEAIASAQLVLPRSNRHRSDAFSEVDRDQCNLAQFVDYYQKCP